LTPTRKTKRRVRIRRVRTAGCCAQDGSDAEGSVEFGIHLPTG
jgi:hypothetical protein